MQIRSSLVLGLLAQLLLAAAAWAQAPATAPDTTPRYRVAERFEVGASTYVRALSIEKGATMWVGTSGGVHEVDVASGKLRGTYTREHGLANEYVFAVGIDREGYKWFGTNAGGASRFKDGKWKTYFPMHGLADYWIYSFANQKDGTFWIGTWAGVSRFDLRTGKFRNYVKELVNEWVYGIAVDASDRVWFGTEGGVSLYDGKTWKSWTHKDGLGAPNTANLPASTNTGLGTRSRHDLSTLTEGNPTYNPNYVFSILSARDGSIWAGTWGGGAARYDGRQWTNFTDREGMAGNIVYSMVQEPGGAIWFGTNNGVARYDGKTWQRVLRSDGLIDANVYALALAPSGDVWAGTKGGVARISRAPAARQEK